MNSQRAIWPVLLSQKWECSALLDQPKKQRREAQQASSQHLHCPEVYSKTLQQGKALKDIGLEVMLLFPANNDHGSTGTRY